MQHSKLASIALALTVALSVFAGGAFAATPSIDTESTNTTTTSDWTDGYTVSGFTANASNSSYVEVTFDANVSGDARLQILDPDTGETVADMESVYTNSSADVTDSTNNHYAWNISHDEFEDLPVGYGENKTFKVRITDTQDTDNATVIDVAFNNTADRAVYRIGDAFTNNDVTVEEKHPWLSQISSSYDTNIASFELASVATGSNASHEVNLANGTVADAFALAAEDKDDGAFLPLMTVKAEGDDGTVLIPVFVNEKSSEWDFLDDDEAYAVYDSDAEELTIMNNGDERFDGVSETTFTLAGNDGLSFGETFDLFRGLGAGYTDSIINSVSSYGSAAL
ncbi:hypothetical protein [Haloferax sulfurifontis]|uniref:Uncharacterized protein n=2 Tax=Haloferax sulfurifontis TaxID=255616 RepID=M0IMB6_9EURY|nr:hypothetical protein [Haloferax sulfurifontis]ELZ96594.1 hypothetical protein C441_04479 [Haloferax sulfurifontis ATCC BAA-897]GGC72598.1 hypothetical protein GCM10007209_38200 [Haloferax sulfurifontis]